MEIGGIREIMENEFSCKFLTTERCPYGFLISNHERYHIFFVEIIPFQILFIYLQIKK